MPGASTPNLGLIVPTVGGDVGDWGTELNDDLEILDALGAFIPTTFAASTTLVPGTNPWSVYYGMGGAAGIVFTLPNPGAARGKIITIKKLDATVGTVSALTPSGFIDGFSTWTLGAQYQFVTMHSDGNNWNVIANN